MPGRSSPPRGVSYACVRLIIPRRVSFPPASPQSAAGEVQAGHNPFYNTAMHNLDRSSLRGTLLLLLLCTLTVDAAAAPSAKKRALIVELMNRSNVHVLGAGFMVQMMAIGEPGVSFEQRLAVQEKLASDPEARKMIEESFVASYDETFSEEELRQLIAFYKTPLGQKAAQLNLQLGVQGRGELAGRLGAQLEVALQRSKTKRTMADLRSLATAAEAYATDYNAYPEAKNLDELEQHLSPTYIRRMPKEDAWGNRFVYLTNKKRDAYRIISAGPDGKIESESLRMSSKPKAKSDDIIFENGEFLFDPLGE